MSNRCGWPRHRQGHPVRLHHSAIPKPDPVHVPTPRTPASAYAYCRDCLADAGEPCVDSKGKPKMLCAARVLGPRYQYRVQS
jgi:hypothetical protein